MTEPTLKDALQIVGKAGDECRTEAFRLMRTDRLEAARLLRAAHTFDNEYRLLTRSERQEQA